MLYRDVNGDVTDVVPGVNGQVLTLVGGVPDWTNPDVVVKESFQADAVDAIFKQINIDLGGGAAVIANPSTDTEGTHFVLSYDESSRRGTPWQKHAPQSYSGGDLAAHIFWAPDGANNAGTARLAVAIERNEAGHPLGADAFAAAVFATTAAAGAGGTEIETVINISGASLDGITAGDPLRLFFARVGDDAVNDTLNVKLLLVRIVIEEV
jgi:hypothetical protein